MYSNIKYKSPSSSNIEAMAKVKVFEKQITLKGQGHSVKIMV